jgi:hypothetical protein
MAGRLITSLMFVASVNSEYVTSQPPPVFWKWDNTGLPIPNSQRGRSSPILDLVEPKGDSYSACWALYNPKFLNKNALSYGTYNRDSPETWSGSPNNLGDQLEEGRERLLLGKRIKLSQGPRRRKRMADLSSDLEQSSSRQSRMVVIDPQFGIPIFVPDSEVQKTLSVLRDAAMSQQKKGVKIFDRIDQNLDLIEPPSVVKKTKLYRYRSENEIDGPIYKEKSYKALVNQTQRQCSTEGSEAVL